jgi:hypothetical protein
MKEIQTRDTEITRFLKDYKQVVRRALNKNRKEVHKLTVQRRKSALQSFAPREKSGDSYPRSSATPL